MIVSNRSIRRRVTNKGPRDCREMWLIIGAMALITPIGLLAFRRFLQTGQTGAV